MNIPADLLDLRHLTGKRLEAETDIPESIICPSCGDNFDIDDLAQLGEHVHDPSSWIHEHEEVLTQMNHPIPCPACREELYTTSEPSGEISKHISGANLASDKDGTYMVCLHCKARVAFVREHGKMVVAKS